MSLREQLVKKREEQYIRIKKLDAITIERWKKLFLTKKEDEGVEQDVTECLAENVCLIEMSQEAHLEELMKIHKDFDEKLVTQFAEIDEKCRYDASWQGTRNVHIREKMEKVDEMIEENYKKEQQHAIQLIERLIDTDVEQIIFDMSKHEEPV